MTAPRYSRSSSASLSDDDRDASSMSHRRLGTMRRECAYDQISAMRTQEESESYRTRDYLADLDDIMMVSDGGDDSRGPIDESCRRKMSMWSTQVVDFFQFGSRESVHMASAYLDRFLSSSDEAAQRALLNRKEYQLFSMTALYLAIKIQETIEVDLSIMEKLSRGDYTAKDFLRAEVELIRSLRWRLNDPTPTEFVRRFVSLLPGDVESPPSLTSASSSTPTPTPTPTAQQQEQAMSDEYMIMDFARFQTEISVTDYSFVATRPSLIATASVLNAVDNIENLSLTNQQKQDFVHAVQEASEINIHSPEVRGVREKLRIRFNKSRGRSSMCESDARSIYTYCSSGTGIELQRKTTTSSVVKSSSSIKQKTAASSGGANGCAGSNESSPVCVRRVSVDGRR